ncbi:MAG: N-acetyl-gamma-glutamyl-phosphate reductase [Sphingobacteriales bacterium]|nr:MAG: N-acetyl-gamma-glutamyl-phosphate reductase [Sphingobacteriales bacterium]
MIKAGIVGATGYTGGELIRILLQHPNTEIAFCYSRSKHNIPITSIHDDIFDTDIFFTNEIDTNVDVVFLCLPHGETSPFLKQHTFSNHTKIIDLSNDFRLQANAQDFVYGLPELNKEKIKVANKIANPGCFATAIQLSLLPLAKHQLLTNEIHVSATTGSTGAGNSLSETSHFTWRNNNFSTYKTLTHQHLDEINENLTQLQTNYNQELYFVPYRGNFTRGILATSIITCNETIDDIYAMYQNYYAAQPFVQILRKNIHLKQVVNTNYCIIYLEKQKNKLIIVAALDNLLKGAAGQAVQNMNLIFGLDEKTGLMLKNCTF